MNKKRRKFRIKATIIIEAVDYRALYDYLGTPRARNYKSGTYSINSELGTLNCTIEREKNVLSKKYNKKKDKQEVKKETVDTETNKDVSQIQGESNNQVECKTETME